MPRKTYRPEEIIAKLRQAEVLLGEGKKVPEVVKPVRISEVFCCRQLARTVARSSPPTICRQVADETRHHGPARLSTPQHGGSPQPRTVQHNRARATTPDHAFGRFPKPDVAGSIPAGGAMFSCIWARSEFTAARIRPELLPDADILPTRRDGTTYHRRS